VPGLCVRCCLSLARSRGLSDALPGIRTTLLARPGRLHPLSPAAAAGWLRTSAMPR